jgi:hypothetical protein
MIIIGHTITAGFYLAVMVQSDPYLPAPFVGFGLLTMIAVPLLAGVLVHKHCYAIGVALLVSSLASAAILGTSRFILSDTTSFGVQDWAPMIHLLAALLLLFEGLGCWVSWRLL